MADVSSIQNRFRKKYSQYRKRNDEKSENAKKSGEEPLFKQSLKQQEKNALSAKNSTHNQTTQQAIAQKQEIETKRKDYDHIFREESPASTPFMQQSSGNAENGNRMQQKLSQYEPHIRAAAARYNLPEELIAGVVWQESRANYRATSHCGAMGLMQLMPGTAKQLGVSNAYDPAQNIDGGAKYLRQMIDKFGRVDHAVAAYNAGPGNVSKYGGVPPFKETQNYVPKVLGYAQSFRVAGGFMNDNTRNAVVA